MAKLALVHGVNTNLLFKWRRQYRAGDFGAPAAEHVPTTIEQPPPATAPLQLLAVVARAAEVGAPPPPASGTIEVQFARVTVRIGGRVEPAVLRTVLDCLATH